MGDISDRDDLNPRLANRWRHVSAALLVLTAAASALFTNAPGLAQSRDRFEEERNRMVDNEIAREGVKNPAVLRSMRTVPRHEFCTREYRSAAYYDQALPIGKGQTISPPFIVAYMTEMLDPQPEDRVLEIGTGSGYQAAVLSGIVKDVYTIEVVPELGKKAATVLNKLKYTNVHTRIGDGYKGWPEAAPFDKIIVTCSPESVPQPLVEQLKEGGRMIIPLGERYEQRFYLFEKKQGKLEKSGLLPALFVPMTQEAERERKVKPDPAHPHVNNGGFERLDESGEAPIGWHYQRQVTLAADGAPEGKHYITLSNNDPGRSAMLLQGMGFDGRAVGSAEISLWIRGGRIRAVPGTDLPDLKLQYYDSERRPLGIETIDLSRPTDEWKQRSLIINPPKQAREAIIRIGLNGAIGELSIDDVRLTPHPK